MKIRELKNRHWWCLTMMVVNPQFKRPMFIKPLPGTRFVGRGKGMACKELK